jgi:holliday junction DNA helicase RuvA
MFAKLTGNVDSIGQDSLILDVGGVGYHVFASSRTLSQLGASGSRLSLFIETQVREDHIHLFGFLSVEERDWFRLLTSVQGVGARSGLAILSVCPAENLSLTIAAGDASRLRQADGVGPKLATRIVTELKDKVQNMVLPSTSKNNVVKVAVQTSAAQPHADQDAVSALINLGYGRAEAFSAVAMVRQKSNDNELDLQNLIRLALKELAS